MKTTRHVFSDNREAQAFICGVNWVNDSMLDVQDVEVGDEVVDGERRLVATVVVNEDDDSDEESTQTLDHREHL